VDLFQAFREDHAILGRGFFEISAHLRAGDLPAAKACAERVDREGGAHIAYEERFFYPALRRLLGDAEVDRLYDEHGEGLAVIRALASVSDGVMLGESARDKVLRQSEVMEAHVAECGELFGTMGRIPSEEQGALLRDLLALRKEAPRWTEVAAKAESKRDGA
jgi:hypothetical protein